MDWLVLLLRVEWTKEIFWKDKNSTIKQIKLYLIWFQPGLSAQYHSSSFI